jgi:hypothetical protein
MQPAWLIKAPTCVAGPRTFPLWRGEVEWSYNLARAAPQQARVVVAGLGAMAAARSLAYQRHFDAQAGRSRQPWRRPGAAQEAEGFLLLRPDVSPRA